MPHPTSSRHCRRRSRSKADNATAREALADFYWGRFREAELASDLTQREFYGGLVADYHDGKYTRQLLGHGAIALDSDPPGAEVSL